MRWRSWWEEPGWERRVRVDLAEIMEDLEPGWAAWADTAVPAGTGR